MNSETLSLKTLINKFNFPSKESSYYSIKLLKKKDFMLLANKLIYRVHDSRNAKEPYQSFIRKKTENK